MTLVLIDLSSLARPIYEASTDLLSVHTSIVQRVRELSSAHPHTAICCDSGRSFRKDLDPTYKATRGEVAQVYYDQLNRAIEILKADGFPVWSIAGYEADDLIGTACFHAAMANARRVGEMTNVLIISSDKDLLQLISEEISQFRHGTGTAPAKTYTVEAVIEKFGVSPHQMLDYLSLVGDKSDNIVGAKGIGAVTAAKLLNTFGNLDDLYAAVDNGGIAVTPAVMTSLLEFRARLPLVRSLITLKTDAPIPFEEIFKPRVAADVATFGADDDIAFGMPTLEDERDVISSIMTKSIEAGARRAAVAKSLDGGSVPIYDIPTVIQQVPQSQGGGDSGHYNPPKQELAMGRVAQATALTVREPFERQLEPTSIAEAKQLAQWMFESRLFSAYGSPQAVLATVLAGRELGLQAMASLRAFHIIDGRPTMSAGAIHTLVLRSGLAKYFRCTERTDERATFITKRGDDPEVTLTFTVEDAKRAWTKEPAKFATSGWGKNPADMCVARALTKLARLVYSDVLAGVYAGEEFDQ